MNPYDTLGLKPGASKSEIRKAYRKLALKYHPDKDRSPGAQDRFIEIKKAFEWLNSAKTQTVHTTHTSANNDYYKFNIAESLIHSMFGTTNIFPNKDIIFNV